MSAITRWYFWEISVPMIDAEVYPGGSEPWCCVALGASGFSAQTGEEYVCIYIYIMIII
jgi:hypothetical protein